MVGCPRAALRPGWAEPSRCPARKPFRYARPGRPPVSEAGSNRASGRSTVLDGHHHSVGGAKTPGRLEGESLDTEGLPGEPRIHRQGDARRRRVPRQRHSEDGRCDVNEASAAENRWIDGHGRDSARRRTGEQDGPSLETEEPETEERSEHGTSTAPQRQAAARMARTDLLAIAQVLPGVRPREQDCPAPPCVEGQRMALRRPGTPRRRPRRPRGTVPFPGIHQVLRTREREHDSPGEDAARPPPRGRSSWTGRASWRRSPGRWMPLTRRG